ncbi:MAG TPA: hypothetical protein VNS55_05270 [Nocardioides sp.]|nr:hypothetical protein [Nocardioides sp.]
MKKTLLAALVVMGTTAAAATVTPTATAAGDGPDRLICDNTKGDPYTGRYASVRVPKGASCYLDGAVVLGNLNALHQPVDVYVINTRVDRNIHVRGAQRDVKIGPADCEFDPEVGNNIFVTRSHNVAICYETVAADIRVTRNDGRIIVRDSHAGSNIKVNDNLPYDRQPGDGVHPDIEAIRLRDNTADRHIVVKRNHGRPLIMSNNTPTPIT